MKNVIGSVLLFLFCAFIYLGAVPGISEASLKQSMAAVALVLMPFGFIALVWVHFNPRSMMENMYAGGVFLMVAAPFLVPIGIEGISSLRILPFSFDKKILSLLVFAIVFLGRNYGRSNGDIFETTFICIGFNWIPSYAQIRR